MFRHVGEKRRPLHNIKLAILLSFVAGIVNVTGFYAVGILTTNVTGHFAFIADGAMERDFSKSLNFLSYTLSFLSGAFLSSLLAEYFNRKRTQSAHAPVIWIEISIISFVAVFGTLFKDYTALLANLLLFAMGLQNAIVSRISNAVVRTTHLTGLFTDLGIELAQLAIGQTPADTQKITTSIRLRLTIITSFFTGCITGGVGYRIFNLHILFLAAAGLIMALTFRPLRYRMVLLRKAALMERQ